MNDLRRANVFLEAVMDHLDTGAIAVDAAGVIQAVNRPARDYLGLQAGDLRGRPLKDVLERHGLEAVGGAAYRVAGNDAVRSDDVEVRMGGKVRTACASPARPWATGSGRSPFGRVLILPGDLPRAAAAAASTISSAQRGRRSEGGASAASSSRFGDQLPGIAAKVQGSRIDSPGMERARRARVADADRGRELDRASTTPWCEKTSPTRSCCWTGCASRRHAGRSRTRCRSEFASLGRRVDQYYESGENPKQRAL